jgi:hypothetical protein
MTNVPTLKMEEEVMNDIQKFFDELHAFQRSRCVLTLRRAPRASHRGRRAIGAPIIDR